MTDTELPNEIQKFSLVKGGPVYRLFCRVGLCSEDLEPPFRRALVLASIVWLPLLLLTILGGRFVSGIEIPFLSDIENHVRFLIALPLLLAGETFIQRLLSPRIGNFAARKIIREADMPKFRAAIDSAHRMRDSVTFEILLLVMVVAVGPWFYGDVMASASTQSATWYATPDGERWNLTIAGYWMVFVSLPLFQFFLLRWYFRIVIWFVFLLRVSRLDLNLYATHTDRAGGIGFLNKCAYSFSYGLLAQGALLSGFIAGQVMHFGTDPRGYKFEAAGVLIIALTSVLAPLALFAPKLIGAKWDGGGAFSTFASRYVKDFDDKWIVGHTPTDERLLGTVDIQSLADLGTSAGVIDEMKTVPFSAVDVLYLAAVTLAPVLPLLLFIFSVEDLLYAVLKLLM